MEEGKGGIHGKPAGSTRSSLSCVPERQATLGNCVFAQEGIRIHVRVCMQLRPPRHIRPKKPAPQTETPFTGKFDRTINRAWTAKHHLISIAFKISSKHGPTPAQRPCSYTSNNTIYTDDTELGIVPNTGNPLCIKREVIKLH